MAETLVADLLAPEVVHDPYPVLARLRASSPVHYSEAHHGWLVTRYDDVTAGLKDHGRLSSDRIGALLARHSGPGRDELRTVMGLIQEFMIVKDPPEHTRMRRLVARAFRPQRVAAMERRIGEIADRMMSEFVAAGHTDFAAHFAYPFPAMVVAELIGAPVEDRSKFQTWSDELALVALGGGGAQRGERHARALVGLQQMLVYFGALIERAERDPGEDMISGLLEGDGEGNSLTREEMKTMCALMLFGGHETTTNLLSAGLYALGRFPDQLALLQEAPAARAGGAVEELLRFEPSVKLLVRRATENYELRGQEIRADDRVHLVLSAANRDPEQFAAPDTVDITRSPNPHLAFGKGVHSCIGAQLARIEARVVFTRLFEWLPGLRIPDQDISWQTSSGSRSLTSLHVSYRANR